MSGRPELLGIHHAAIICRDYPVSRGFYVDVLGLRVLSENFRADRSSWKLDLGLPDGSQVELFSFPTPPVRPSYPEAAGLRHLAFKVRDLDAWFDHCERNAIPRESIRHDEYTGKRFFFIHDPDQLPLELYESVSG